VPSYCTSMKFVNQSNANRRIRKRYVYRVEKEVYLCAWTREISAVRGTTLSKMHFWALFAERRSPLVNRATNPQRLTHRPRMEKSHSCWPRMVWCVVNMFRKNGMRPLIIANGTICYSIVYCNSPALYTRLKFTYSVISVKLHWLPGNSKKWTIE